MPFLAKKSASSLPGWLLCAFIQLRVIGLCVWRSFRLLIQFRTVLESVVLLCIACKEALLSEIKWNVCLDRSPYLFRLLLVLSIIPRANNAPLLIASTSA